MPARARADRAGTGHALRIDYLDSVEHALASLRERGFALLGGVTEATQAALVASLGHVVHQMDVRARPSSRALVTSVRYLPPHTDHHRARWIAWQCVRAAVDGGTSILVDGREVYSGLARETRRALRGVRLREHSVFDGDMDQHPMVSEETTGAKRIYYSCWLCDELLEPTQREAFELFAEAVRRAPRREHRLVAGDVLVIDNGRMLHGRTAFGDVRRWLRRSWIG